MKYLITVLCLLGTTGIKAQKVFEPARVFFDNKYNLFLARTLIGNSDSYYLCKPYEYALSLQDNKLVYVYAVEAIYKSFGLGLEKSKTKAKTQQFQLTLTDRQQQPIYRLLRAAAETANTYNDKRMGEDGVTYTLSSCGHMVSTWSPKKKHAPLPNGKNHGQPVRCCKNG